MLVCVVNCRSLNEDDWQPEQQAEYDVVGTLNLHDDEEGPYAAPPTQPATFSTVATHVAAPVVVVPPKIRSHVEMSPNSR